MTHAKLRPFRDLIELMDREGISWCIRHGSKHDKLMVAGQLCTILPKSGPNHVTRNAIAARRFIAKRLAELGIDARGGTP